MTVIDLSEWRERKRVKVQVELDPFWFYRAWFDFWFGGKR